MGRASEMPAAHTQQKLTNSSVILLYKVVLQVQEV